MHCICLNQACICLMKLGYMTTSTHRGQTPRRHSSNRGFAIRSIIVVGWNTIPSGEPAKQANRLRLSLSRLYKINESPHSLHWYKRRSPNACAQVDGHKLFDFIRLLHAFWTYFQRKGTSLRPARAASASCIMQLTLERTLSIKWIKATCQSTGRAPPAAAYSAVDAASNPRLRMPMTKREHR